MVLFSARLELLQSDVEHAFLRVHEALELKRVWTSDHMGKGTEGWLPINGRRPTSR